MTAPDALVERLAGVLAQGVRDLGWDWETQTSDETGAELARALLPVVEQEIAAARAEERERIADLIVYDLARNGDFMTPSERKGQRRAARIARTAAQTPAAEEPHPTCAHCGHVRGLHGRNHGCISAFPDGRSGGSCGCPGYVTPATSPEEGR